MRRTRLPSFALVLVLVGALSSGVAHASPQCGAFGCSLRWDRCDGDGGVANRNFACDTNVGNETLVASFVPPSNVGSVAGITAIVDLAFAAPAVPAWWMFRIIGSCRLASLNAFGFLIEPPVACSDWAAEAPVSMGLVYSTGVSGSPNRARMVVTSAVAAADVNDLLAEQEYFVGSITITHAKTVGAAACAGCETPVCMVLQSVDMFSPVPGNSCWVSGPANHVDSNVATWQGGGVPVVGDKIGCPAATPTRSSTWGGVKSLYR